MSILARDGQPSVDVIDLAQFEFTNQLDRLRCFHDLLTRPSGDLRAFLRTYIRAGCKIFGTENGFIGQKIGGVVRLVVSESSLDSLFDGQLIQVNEPLIEQFLPSNPDHISEKLTFDHFTSPKLSYNGIVVQNVIAQQLEVYNDVFGILCFFSTQANPRTYSADDHETLGLMAKGVAKMIELQSAYKDQKQDSYGYASPGVKHFDDYLMQARLPEAYGVAGKVIEVLKNRVGHAPLGISDIASELSLSKRTLQRRLQQQDLSFADLRDKVRFHYSIDYLIEQNASIDSISNALDFSDRTSFTNAFKRWTGLSPSAFRKLFRDYT